MTSEIEPLAAERGIASQTEGERALALVKGAIFLAKQYPRDEVAATKKILGDCGDVSVAEKATYTYARAGTKIDGPSIRLAELILRRWGNMEADVVEIEQRRGEKGMESVVMTFAWDFETNAIDRKQFVVPHARDKKGGAREFLTDARDVYERVASDGARRKRANILALIPAHVVDQAVGECQKALEQKYKPTAEAVKKMLEEFGRYGVGQSQIEQRIQRRLEAVTARQMVVLKGVLNSLDDGMSAVSDHFDMAAKDATAKTGTLAEQAKAKLREDLGEKPPEAVEPAPPDNSPDALITKIRAAYKGKTVNLAVDLTKLYAKPQLTQLTEPQMLDFWENHCGTP